MIGKRIGLLIFIFALLSLKLLGQELQTDPQSIISNILEDVAASSEEDVDLDALSEELLFYADNPINLKIL